MARAPPTDPEDLPAVEEIEAVAGPRETTIYDDHGVMTVLPTRWWAAYDRRGDPRRQLLRAAYEDLERKGKVEDADAWI